MGWHVNNNGTTLYAGAVCDTLQFDYKMDPSDFVLDFGYKVIPTRTGYRSFSKIGKPFICVGEVVISNSKIKDNYRIDMLNNIPEGSIQIIDGRDRLTVAHFGDISALLAEQAGCGGTHVIGNVRDVNYIIKNDYPVTYTNNVVPTDAFGKWQIIDIATKYMYATPWGTYIKIPEDSYVFYSEEALILLPKDLEEFLQLVDIRIQHENEVRQNYKQHTPTELYSKFGRW